jgi:hypothetical protein
MDKKIIITIIIILVILFLIFRVDTFTSAAITQLNAKGSMDERLIGSSHQRFCIDPLYQLDLPLKKTQEPYYRC